MHSYKAFPRVLLASTLFYLIGFAAAVCAQQANPVRTADRTDEVIRIKTELVQTEVMVFDRQGRFVDGLKPEQFELNLSGARQPISFFERITAGSSLEAAQLSAAHGNTALPTIPKTIVSGATDRGRVIFFFVDDAHLGPPSLARAREALKKFVDDQLNPYDQVAIVSASGQIGFLQQLTDNPVVLHAAIARLNYQMTSELYTGNTQISEYMASQVLDSGNRELYAYLLESTKIEQQMGPGSRHGDHQLAASYSAAPHLRNRLRQISGLGRMTTEGTLKALESLMLSSSALPGRKVVFFLSDGFILNERKGGALELLHRVTRAAARSGVVVYTMDLRGSLTGLGSAADASTNVYADSSARRAGLALGEMTATQESLQLIADQTGGRAIFNAKSIGEGILQAMRETADYYLLAWRPDSQELRETKLRLRVTIRDRPDLKVRLRNSFYSPPTEPIVKSNKAEAEKTNSPNPSEVELVATLGTLYPQKLLPVSLAVGYLNSRDAGLVLNLSMQIDRQALNLNAEDGAGKAEVDVLGAALDDRGQFASFKQLLTVVPDPAPNQHTVTWNQQLQLKPGLYQVRVAVRERSTGRMGSALQWIEIPDTAAGRFGLSSLFLGERKDEPGPAKSSSAGAKSITVDVDHRFASASVLRFQTYVYNAVRTNKGPDVWVQAQVLRNRRPVMSIAPVQVPSTTDAARLPYWAEIPLNSLPSGEYVLLVSATDRIGDRSASQRIKFAVD